MAPLRPPRGTSRTEILRSSARRVARVPSISGDRTSTPRPPRASLVIAIVLVLGLLSIPPAVVSDSKVRLFPRWRDAGSLHPHARAFRQHVAVAAFQDKSHEACVEQESHFRLSLTFAKGLLRQPPIATPRSRRSKLGHTVSSMSLDYLATRRHAGHVRLRTIRHVPIAQLQPVRTYRPRGGSARATLPPSTPCQARLLPIADAILC